MSNLHIIAMRTPFRRRRIIIIINASRIKKKITLKSFGEIVFFIPLSILVERYAVSPRWRHARYYYYYYMLVYKYIIIMETRAYTICIVYAYNT